MLISHNKCNDLLYFFILSHNRLCDKINNSLSYFSKSRTKALYRIGPHKPHKPHNMDVLCLIICGMLGDWWADQIKGKISPSVRFSIEQGINNTAYIHNLTLYFYKSGYCSNITPHLVKKSDKKSPIELQDRFNYRLTLYTFTSLLWIYDSFYKDVNGKKIKVIPSWIGDYITPLGLAHLIMQVGSLKKEGLVLNLNLDSFKDLYFMKTLFKGKI